MAVVLACPTCGASAFWSFAREGDPCYDCGSRLTAQPDPRLNVPLARVLLERAQDGYVNPAGGKTTGRERKDV